MTDKSESAPPGWEIVPLADVAIPSTEKAEPSAFKDSQYIGLEHIEGGTQRILGTGDVSSVKSTKAVFRSGDVLYGKLRPYLNKVCRPDFDGVCSTDILVFPHIRDLDNGYLMHFLSRPSTAEYATQNASGINLPRVSAKTLGEMDFPLAPIAEQRRIVAKIEALQERSRKARELLTEVGPLLEQFCQSLLAAAFRGDLTADWREQNPNTEPATELLARIREERRQKWEHAELTKYEAKGKNPPNGWNDKYKEPEPLDVTDLPELPNGWCWTSLGQLTLIDSGEAFKKKDYSESGIRLFQIANVSFGQTLWDQKNFLPNRFAESHGFLLLENTDMAIALNRPILDGRLKVTRLTDEDLPAILYQRVGRMRTAIGSIADYLFAFMRGPSMLKQVESKLQGSDQPYINTSDIPRIIVPLAPLVEQAEIVRICNAAMNFVGDQLVELAESKSDLSQLEQSILATAFRGELVPQDPNDEPASVLLERIREARAHKKEKTKGKGKKTTRSPKRNTAMTKTRFDDDVKGQPYLAKLMLASTGKPTLTAEELFQIAQLPLPDFYKQLDFEVTQQMLVEREGRLEPANAT